MSCAICSRGEREELHTGEGGGIAFDQKRGSFNGKKGGKHPEIRVDEATGERSI